MMNTPMTSLAAPTRDDLLYVVDDPAGTPAHYEATVQAVVAGPSLLVAASNAPASTTKVADYVCDGTADDVQIQAAIDALPAGGGRVLLSEGAFTTAAIIELCDNLVIAGAGTGATHVQGTHSGGGNQGIFDSQVNVDLSYVELRDMRMSRLTGGTGGCVRFHTNTGDANYTGCKMINLDMYSENKVNFPYSAGHGLEIRDCVFRGSDVVADSYAMEIGYRGQPRFFNCSFIGGDTDTAIAGAFSDNGGGVFFGCYFESRYRSVYLTSSANPRFIGCEFVGSEDIAVESRVAAAPIFQGCRISPKFHSWMFRYALVDQIDALVSDRAYRIYSMFVLVDSAQAGRTLDIGSSLGASDIASAVDLTSTGKKAIAPPRDVLFAANAPIYLTPSGAVDDEAFRVFFSIVLDFSDFSVELTSIGEGIFSNCHVYGSPEGVYLTGNSNTLVNCVVECPDRTEDAISNDIARMTRLINCTVLGAENNVSSYERESSGTGTIANGTTSDVITHGLDGTPTVDGISITLAEDPTNTPGAIWVDTIGATNFTVNCENDPGASNLDFGWKAEL